MPFSKRLIIILIIVTVAPLLPLIDQIYMKLLPVLDFCLLYCASYTLISNEFKRISIFQVHRTIALAVMP